MSSVSGVSARDRARPHFKTLAGAQWIRRVGTQRRFGAPGSGHHRLHRNDREVGQT
jgi:hypothetical protein